MKKVLLLLSFCLLLVGCFFQKDEIEGISGPHIFKLNNQLSDTITYELKTDTEIFSGTINSNESKEITDFNISGIEGSSIIYLKIYKNDILIFNKDGGYLCFLASSSAINSKTLLYVFTINQNVLDSLK